jgi:cyanophycinase
MMRSAVKLCGVSFLLATLLASCSTAPAPRRAAAPARATVVGPEIMERFLALAGGRDARIVIMPGAGTEESFPSDWGGSRTFRDAGVKSVTVLHTRSREEANSERFVAPLREATGVWIPGGRQWRLADTFLGTRTLRELHALLARGGVIGGTSAGASIQASYMVRGAVEGNTVMMAPGHEEGFGFLRDAAVDQHLTARNRQEDMLQVVGRHSRLLGIGLDESTAIVVRGDRAEVIGSGRVAFYNTRDANGMRYYFLQPGDVFDLAERRTVRGRHLTPDDVRDEQAVLRTMNRLFEAMRQKDTVTIRAIAHPELRLFVPQAPAGTRSTVRVSGLDQFIASIAAAQQRLDERPYTPQVRVDGPLAAVWTYYEFWRGEEFSHCGTDALHFARAGETAWQIIGLAYTVQREGCRRLPRT